MKIVFVCTGNICRSPIADVVLRHLAVGTPMTDGSTLADHLDVSSAGTGNWHAGEPMDPRAAAVLHAHGYVDHGHRARAFETAWLEDTDLVVSMARHHHQTLRSLARHRAQGRGDHEAKLVLLRAYDPKAQGRMDVPDPYYGDDVEFEECLAMIEAGCRGLNEHLRLEMATQLAEAPKVRKDSAS
jgi:protein-tyrosine phosphatase